MTAPTGNRWWNPDTQYYPDDYEDEALRGNMRPREDWKLANPDNVIHEDGAPKDATMRKFGTAFTHGADRSTIDAFDLRDQAIIAGLTEAERDAFWTLGDDDRLALLAGRRRGQTAAEAALTMTAPVLTTTELVPPADQRQPRSPILGGDFEELKARIRELGSLAQQGDAEATAELNQIAEDEHGRPDPREGIVKRLYSYGIKKPERIDG